MSNESGESSYPLFIQSFPEPGVKQQVSTNGVFAPPRWSRDGKELFYIAPDLTLMAISVKTAGSALEAGVPVRLFKARCRAGSYVASTTSPQTAASSSTSPLLTPEFHKQSPSSSLSAAPQELLLKKIASNPDEKNPFLPTPSPRRYTTGCLNEATYARVS